MVFSGTLSLGAGIHHLWLAASVRSDANIDQAVFATISSATMADPDSHSVPVDSLSARRLADGTS